MKTNPVLISFIMSLFYITSYAGHPINFIEPICSNLTVSNNSLCDQEVYIEHLGEGETIVLLGTVKSGEERIFGTTSEIGYIFSESSSGGITASYLKSDCDDIALKITSCNSQVSELDTPCVFEGVSYKIGNGNVRELESNLISLECGQSLDINLKDTDGKWVIQYPDNSLTLFNSSTDFNITSSAKISDSGIYTAYWFANNGCKTEFDFTIQSLNCCERTMSTIRDVKICEGESIMIIPEFSDVPQCIDLRSDYVSSVYAYSGRVENVNNILGEPDNSGAILWKAGTASDTYITVDLGSVLPSGTEICVLTRIAHCQRVDSNDSRFSIYTSASVFGFGKIATKSMPLDTKYEKICLTVNKNTRYMRIQDEGLCAFRIDAIEVSSQNETTSLKFLWNNGGVADHFLIKEAGTYSVQVTDCNECTTYAQFDVEMEACETADLDCVENPSLPVAAGEIFSMCAEELGLNGNISINDEDIDGHELEWIITKQPDNGQLEIGNSGTFTYIPNVGFSGLDRIFYNVCKKDFIPCDQRDLNLRCAAAILQIDVNKASVSLGEDLTICEDESTTLTIASGLSASWSTGQSSNTISVNQAGIYAVSITDANGCRSADQLEVRQYDYPAPDLSVSNVIDCNNPTAVISADDGVSYLWSTGQSGPSIAVGIAGLYTVTVTGEGGCMTIEDIEVIENVKEIRATIRGENLICYSTENTTLTAEGADRYEWSTGETGTSITAGGAGTYTVTAIDNASGCSATESFTITSVNIYADAGPDQNACPGDILILGAAAIGPAGARYQWSNGSSGTLNDSGGRISVSPTRTTTYELRTTLNGCTEVDQVTVFLDDFQISATGGVEICPGEEVVLSAQGADFYLWDTGEQEASITVRPTETRSYTVIGFNTFGCEKETQVTVTVYDPLRAVVSDDMSVCIGESVSLSASGGSVYEWSNGSVGPNISVIADESTEYLVTVTNNQGCSTVESINVNVIPLPIADIGADRLICSGSSIAITAAFSSSYLWSTGQTSRSITVSPTSDTEYSITVTNEGLCESSNSISVNVVECLGRITGYVRNTNGDNLSGVNLRIFDENDNRVATASTDLRGFYRFTQVEAGTYVIRQENLEGYSDFSDRDETPEDGIDNDGVNNEIPVILLPGETDADNIFVDQENSSAITGTSFVDTDGDNLADEPLRDAAIMLYNEREELIDVTVTGPFGRYSFEGLSSGTYSVRQDQLSGYEYVLDQDRTITDIDPDGGKNDADGMIEVELSVSEIDDGNDFIVRPLTGKISGHVGLDTDDDRRADAPVVDARVELLNRFGTRQQITYTDSDGDYEFIDIEPGEYLVTAIDDPKFRDISDRDESTSESDTDGGADVIDDYITVILLPGEHDADNNFVDYIPQVGTIGGYVLEDQNDDQIGDRGINDVVITLYDLDNREVAVTKTNGAGRFIFNDVVPGDYYLRETDPVDANGLEFTDVSDLDVMNPDDLNDVDGANDIIYVSVEVDEFDDGNIFVDKRPSSSVVENCRVLQFDDFSNGFGDFWIDGGEYVDISQRFSRSAPSSIDISNNEGVNSSIYSQSIDLNTVNSVTVTFHYLTRGVDAGEFFVFEISRNGGASFSGFDSWFIDADFVNEEWNTGIVYIPREQLSAQSVFRIKSEFSSRADHIYIDDILVELCFNVEDDDSSATAYVGQNDGSQLNIGEALDKEGYEPDRLFPADTSSGDDSIFPNPATDEIQFYLNNQSDSEVNNIEILTIDGQMVIREQVSNQGLHKLDISKLASQQLYIINIKSSDQIRSHKFFKL